MEASQYYAQAASSELNSLAPTIRQAIKANNKRISWMNDGKWDFFPCEFRARLDAVMVLKIDAV